VVKDKEGGDRGYLNVLQWR